MSGPLMPERVVFTVEVAEPSTIARAWRHLGPEGRAALLAGGPVALDPKDVLLPISWRRPPEGP